VVTGRSAGAVTCGAATCGAGGGAAATALGAGAGAAVAGAGVGAAVAGAGVGAGAGALATRGDSDAGDRAFLPADSMPAQPASAINAAAAAMRPNITFAPWRTRLQLNRKTAPA
jgi:hypothetical protein